MNYLLIQQATDLYNLEKWTIRRIADKLNCSNHLVKRELIKNGVSIDRNTRLRKPMSQETKDKMSKSRKGCVPWSKGKKMSLDFRREQMIIKLKTDIDFSKYQDIDRLLFLTKITTKHIRTITENKINRWDFIDKFYSDTYFIKLYTAWVSSGNNQWFRPSIDHLHPKSKGGEFSLDNLNFITWFENRAKADMTEDEWRIFKIKTNTNSDLFS